MARTATVNVKVADLPEVKAALEAAANENRRMRDALSNLVSATPCDVCYEDDWPGGDCDCSCHRRLEAAQTVARALLSPSSGAESKAAPPVVSPSAAASSDASAPHPLDGR